MSAVLAKRLTANPRRLLAVALAKSLAPRRPRLVSTWADQEFVLSQKGSQKIGKWRTDNNPPLREPLDAMTARSGVHEIVLRFPIQFGKTMVVIILAGYTITEHPGPIAVFLPSEATQKKWISQKFNPMVEETEAVRAALTSTASRDAANTATFKDFAGGQIYIEHAGTPSRLKMLSARTTIVDEVDDFVGQYSSGDDPIDMIEGRSSSFPNSYLRAFIGTPQLKGTSRIDAKYEASDQRRYYVPCPHCGHEQPLEWAGLQWAPDAARCWYMCRENSCVIEEHEKTAMIRRGRWVAENPGAKTRGYTINCLYYQFGLGPQWLELVAMWLAAQKDPAKLKVFINERLAEAFEDPAMRAVKHNVIRDRAEPYRLRVAPYGVLAITAGVDTQDNRLAVHIVGWGRGQQAWTLDYIELPGDPADDAVWVMLVDLLNRPIEHASGGVLRVEAVAIDAGGHRTEAVKNFCRAKDGVAHPLRRPMCIFGAKPNNAPVLSKGKLVDVTWNNKLDKRGVVIYHVGTVAVKHMLYSRISTDTEKAPEARMVHLSEDLPPEFFAGLVSETYDPAKNRFVKKNGTRNEVLDTWVYAFAATHHPELRLHRRSRADWDAIEAKLAPRAAAPAMPAPTEAATPPAAEAPLTKAKTEVRGDGGSGSSAWSSRL